MVVATSQEYPIPPHITSLPLAFTLNRKKVVISPFDTSVSFDSTLLEYLREHAHLTGTKLGCGEGGCGACTVAILRPKSRASLEQEKKQFGRGNGMSYEIKAVNACLMPLVAVHGAQVITVEGIGTAANPHAIQQRLAFLFGSVSKIRFHDVYRGAETALKQQCGMCTPGFVIAFYAALRNAGKEGLSEQDIEKSMDGNLCRCTGYRPILDAFKSFARRVEPDTRVNGNGSDFHINGNGNGSWEEDVQESRRQSDDITFSCPKGADCCKNKKSSKSSCAESSPLPKSSLSIAKERIDNGKEDSLLPYEHASEPIFPAWLSKQSHEDQFGRSVWDCQDLALVDEGNMPNRYGNDDVDLDEEDSLPPTATSKGTIWLRPASLSSLLKMMQFYSERGVIVKLRSGDSECRIEVKFLKRKYNVNIFMGNIPSLCSFARSDNCLEIGANLPLQDLMVQLKACLMIEKNDYAKQVYRAILTQLAHFASTQIRNVASLGGNISTASPISDLNPVWMALDAYVEYIDSSKGVTLNDDDSLLSAASRKIHMRDFFVGYRKTALPPNAVISRIIVPLPKPVESTENLFIRAYKQAKRKDDDIAIVTCCLFIRANKSKKGNDIIIEEARLAYGGMAPMTVFAKHTTKLLEGKIIASDGKLQEKLLLEALDCLSMQDFDLKYDVPGGMPLFRKSLTLSFFAKFISEMCLAWGISHDGALSNFQEMAQSHLERPLTRGSQDYENVKVQSKNGSGATVPNLSALKQCTGEADYVDDHPPLSNELIGALVLTTKANARIIKVDATPALFPHGPATHYYTLDDVKKLGGDNVWCPPHFDDRVFCGDMSEAVGLIAGVVLARTRREALDAARLVVVEYEMLGPPILDIDTAIAKGSYYAPKPKIQMGSDGDFEDWSDCDEVIEGETRLGGQEHFYLETNAVLCIPSKEDQQMEIWHSTQNPTESQGTVSSFLNIPSNRITVRTKRLGGGFGGKESRSTLLACTMALASHLSGRPVRCMLDRDKDILISGQRHPFKGTWKIGVNRDGKLKKFDAKVYNNAGWSTDLSQAVIERAMTHIDGVYHFDSMRVHGFLCKTNTVSNTAFRGFGGPQGIMIIEDAMDKVARHIGMRPDLLRSRNFSREGDSTHYGQPILDWNVPKMWDLILETAEFNRRRKAVDDFNKSNRWKKRGLTINGTKFGISFTALHLNQARVLIHIYAHDGSIMLSHGGTEMGQGLYTKVSHLFLFPLQVCSH
jgi:xanthine dehydrogenase/oxidase